MHLTFTVPFRFSQKSGKLLTKTLRVMKLTAIISMIFAMHVSAVGISQTVNFTGKEVTLESVFQSVEKQTGYTFLYKPSVLKGLSLVSISAKGMLLTTFLNQVLSGQPLQYIIENKTIFIQKKEPAGINAKNATGVILPPGSVQGRVTNKNGEAVPSATVLVKGTKIGTATDENGNYNITVPNQESILVFSALGFQAQEIKVGSQTIINITFKQKVEAFNEAIISANLVSSRRKEVASAVTVINSEVIEKLPFKNIAELFRGEVPGAIAWDYGPGSITSPIKLRGDFDFYTTASSVKVFIDGIEVADASYLAVLPLNMIERVEVLRGPQASSLYGSGATSGVVFIYTKKGKYGGPHFNIKLSSGVIASKYVTKTAYTQDHSLNISGSSESISYNFGGSYFHNNPYWENGNNTNIGTFGNVKITQGKFSAGLTGQYSVRNLGTPINPILKSKFPGVASFSTPTNQNFGNSSQTLGISITYKPFTWWENTASVGVDETNNNIDQYAPRHLYPADTLNTKIFVKLNRKTYRYFTSIKFPIGKNFTTGITGGIDKYSFDFSNKMFSGLGVDPNFQIVGSTSLYNNEYANTGYFAQGVFGFYDKVFLTAGFRSETTKSYGLKTPASTAPKLGIATTFRFGKFQLKPRASFGQSIRVPDPSNYIETFADYPEYGYSFHQLANPNLKPQRQVGYDVGVDGVIDNGVASFEITYYNQQVNDFISSISDYSNYPPLIVSQYVNVGEIKNTGLELSGKLNIRPISFRFNYAIINSVVGRVSEDYSYYYKNGDRIMGIPKASGGATITYSFPSLSKFSSTLGGSVSLAATYFGKKQGIDQIKYIADAYGISGNPFGSFSDYLTEYKDYALFRLDANYSLNNNIEVFLNINNLFNTEQFEYDNTYPNRGRHTVLGMRLFF